jgi:hypothetical protein
VLGVRFGSHPEFKKLDEKEIDRERGQSKQTLEDIGSFAYPYVFPEHS